MLWYSNRRELKGIEKDNSSSYSNNAFKSNNNSNNNSKTKINGTNKKEVIVEIMRGIWIRNQEVSRIKLKKKPLVLTRKSHKTNRKSLVRAEMAKRSRIRLLHHLLRPMAIVNWASKRCDPLMFKSRWLIRGLQRTNFRVIKENNILLLSTSSNNKKKKSNSKIKTKLWIRRVLKDTMVRNV